MPPDERVPARVDCPLFTLLWTDARDVHSHVLSALTYHLAVLDPPLALRLVHAADGLLGDDEAAAEAARDELALDLLRSVFFDLQRDLGHAMWRLRESSPETLSRYVGWVGAADAATLTAVDPRVAEQVEVVGDVVTPRSHMLGRRLLTSAFDDAPNVLAGVAAVGEAADPPEFDLDAWASDRAVLAETHVDPFVAAYGFRDVLLAIRAAGRALVVTVGDETVDAGEWAARYVQSALAVPGVDATPLAAHVGLRDRLSAAAFALATFACGGPAHVAAYERENDPLAEWLDRVWLLASRLIAGLPALHGGLAEAVAEAERAVVDLGVGTPTTRAEDRFDPFAFAHQESVGRSMTLVALKKGLDGGERPAWWTAEIEARLVEIAGEAAPTIEVAEEMLGDRLGVGVALRERALAGAVLRAAGPPPEPATDVD